jgi:23S rRNA (cytosine1962-C5)-methyltransferase
MEKGPLRRPLQEFRAMTYSLLDSGDQFKLERFGKYVLARPCAQAVWRPLLPANIWKGADAHFTREQGNKWSSKSLPESWETALHGLKFKVTPTNGNGWKRD